MSLSKSQLYRQTFDAALAFDALQLWEKFDDSVCFPMRVLSSPHLAFVTVMGSGGEEYGITVFRGPDVGTRLLRMLQREALDDGDADALGMISFGMTPLHEVPPPGREFLRAAKVSPRRDDRVPFFLAKDPGKHPRALSRDEVGEMLMILRGLTKLSHAGRLDPSPVVPGAPLHVYAFSGDAQDPDVSVEEGVFPSPPEAAAGLVAFPGDLGELPRLPGAWVIGFPVLPMRIDEIEGSVRCLMVADIKDGHVLMAEIPRRADAEAAIELLRGTFHGKNFRKQKGLPSSAVFTDRELHDAFAPVLSGLGVECSYEPGHPLLEGIKASLGDWLAAGKSIRSAGRGSRARHAEHPDHRAETTPSADEPAPDDLEGWKRADHRLGKRLGEAYFGGRRPADLALARYFGSPRIGKAILGGTSREMAFGAFFEWAAVNYRPGRAKPTAAERLLAGALPEAERRILEARCAARPSVFRITAIDKGGTLTFEDLLFGGSTVVTDRLLSQSAESGYCLVGIVFPVGRFHFLVMTGPPLALGEVTPAVRYLETQGLVVTPEGIGATSHLFGRLWPWLERERALRPAVRQMVNFDGDPLEMHTAHFTVTDTDAVRDALGKRRDIAFEDEEGTAAAWEPAGTRHADRMPGGKVAAGRLRFEGELLIFETNSAERYRRARAWLDKIPGIVFSKLEAQSLDAAIEENRRAPRKPGPPPAPTPEALEQVQRALDGQYLKWLDEKIPALGGKTPRQACKTQQGRREVALMIRTYPDPGGMPGLTVPRSRMFKALGLPESE